MTDQFYVPATLNPASAPLSTGDEAGLTPEPVWTYSIWPTRKSKYLTGKNKIIRVQIAMQLISTHLDLWSFRNCDYSKSFVNDTVFGFVDICWKDCAIYVSECIEYCSISRLPVRWLWSLTRCFHGNFLTIPIASNFGIIFRMCDMPQAIISCNDTSLILIGRWSLNAGFLQ